MSYHKASKEPKERYAPYSKKRIQDKLEDNRRAAVKVRDEDEDSGSDDDEVDDDDDEVEMLEPGELDDDDEQLAAAEDVQKRVNASRHPTLYTYMGTRPTSQLSLAKQGPHTVSFCAVGLGISKVTSDGNWAKLQALFKAQVDLPDDFDAIFNSELSVSNQRTKADKISRAKKAYADAYLDIKTSVEAALRGGLPGPALSYAEAMDRLRSLMEMDPYQTYCWKGGKAAKSSLKGKVEAGYLKQLIGGDKSAIRGLMDIGRVTVSNAAAYKKFILKRIGLILPDDDAQAIYDEYF